MNIPSEMRGVVLTGHGGLDRLEYREDLAVPTPSRDEILIEVAACGMNNTDINTRTGWYSEQVSGATWEESLSGEDGSWSGRIRFPLIQGADPVGRVVSVGADIDDGLIGERVLVDPWLRRPTPADDSADYLGSERNGGYAEYVAVPAVNAHTIESDLSDAELATFPCSYGTAEHMLSRAKVSEGQWVLVTGSSGGVGVALVQLAKIRGAHVVALTSSSKLDAVGELGADIVLDRESGDFFEAVMESTGGVDVVTDVVGSGVFARLLGTIKRGGHYATAGAVGGPIVSLDLRTLYLKDLTMHGTTIYAAETFAGLVSHIQSGALRPVVADTFRLRDLPEAQQAFMTKDHIGAIVIEVADKAA